MITEHIGIIICIGNETVKAEIMGILPYMGFREVMEIDTQTFRNCTGDALEYDLLVTDLDLKTASSVDLVMKLKRRAHPRRLPVMLIVRESERAYYLAARQAGMVDDYIVCPFTHIALKKKIFKCTFRTVCEKIRVLVVDDAAPMRYSVRFSLQQIGFNLIETATSGADALTRMKLAHFDLVITDLNMPQMSGIELIEAMKNDEALSRVPALVLTAENQKDRVLELIKAGVGGYILKPYSQDVLLDKIMGLAPHLL
jgi:two-component system, chemotaxis family, chemotaxis protein CheY